MKIIKPLSKMTKRTPLLSADWLGMASASLCMIHCLITPFLLLGVSQLAWWHDLSWLFLGFSGLAVWLATRTQTQWKIKGLIWFSFTVLFIAVLGEDWWEPFHEISYGASLGLIIGHLWNHAGSRHTHS